MNEFPQGIAHAWSLPVGPASAIAITAALYARGWRIARRTRPGHLPRWRAACFMAGLAFLWIALASPIDALDDFLLAAHMLQHFILMSVVPPLLVLGAPSVPLLRGLPRAFICLLVNPVMRQPWFDRMARFLGHPLTAWLLMNGAYLGWHVPAAFELALRSERWHAFEHLCFLSTSIAFWWTIIEPWPAKTRWPRWAAIPYLLAADLINTILSAFLTFAGRVLYHSYAVAPRVTSLDPLQDQVAAGAEMWVLNSLVFLVPAVLLTLRLLTPQSLLAKRT